MKRVLDPIIELDQQRFDVIKALDLPLLMLTRTEDDTMSHEIMDALAEQDLSGRFFMGVTTKPLFDEAVGASPPFLATFNVLDETVPTYQGPFERTAVLEFANHVASPLIREFDTSSIVTFMKINVFKLSIQFASNVFCLLSPVCP